MTNTQAQPNPRIERDVTRLVLATEQQDTRTQLALITQLAGEMTPIGLIDRLARLVSAFGRGKYGDAWPKTLIDAINSIDIDLIEDDTQDQSDQHDEPA